MAAVKYEDVSDENRQMVSRGTVLANTIRVVAGRAGYSDGELAIAVSALMSCLAATMDITYEDFVEQARFYDESNGARIQ